MKTKILLVLVGITFVVGALTAQRNVKFSKDEIINRKWEYMQEKAQLTPQDTKKTAVIFKEKEEKFWRLMENNKHIHRGSRVRGDNKNMDYESINEAIIRFEIENARIQEWYYLEIKEILPAEIVFRLLNAEKTYKKELIQRLTGRKKVPKSPN